MRFFPLLAMATASISLCPCAVFAQGVADYPAKPVRIIVSSDPGGAGDITTRMIAAKMSENLKQQFLVENRPGAGDTIGAGLAAKSSPDGYTLLVNAPSFTIAPGLYPNLPYDPIRDFAPISRVTRAPLLLAVHPALPVKSTKELIALAKSKPGALDLGVAQGSITHLGAAYLASTAGIKVALIPYKGAAQALLDTVAGQIQVALGNVVGTLPHVRSGRLRVLAVSSAERAAAVPDLATIAESGVPGYDVTTWNGWLAPAGTPPAMINKLSLELARAVKSQDVTKKLLGDGAEPVGSTPEQFQQLIAVEIPRWRKIVNDLGLQAQ